jgi:hypothetical protein
LPRQHDRNRGVELFWNKQPQQYWI